MENKTNHCPCFSGKEYVACCMPFHQGALPENALLLMRSRFSAYALNLADYIIATTHLANPQYSNNQFSWKRSIAHRARQTSFQNLKILDFKEKESLAVVTFTAYLSQNGQDITFTERSYFEKNGRWLYRSGQLAQGYEPNLIPKQFKLLPLAYYGDPVLRRKAEEVRKITPDIKKLVEEMIETMDAYDGIGLAAPQIHRSLRLFVMRQPIQTGENLELGEPKVFINPTLSLHSAEMGEALEACLSIPIIQATVARPKEVTAEYTTIEGNRVQELLSGLEARVVMHEYDHIEGILYIDRLPAEEQTKLTPFLQELQKTFVRE